MAARPLQTHALSNIQPTLTVPDKSYITGKNLSFPGFLSPQMKQGVVGLTGLVTVGDVTSDRWTEERGEGVSTGGDCSCFSQRCSHR